MTTIEKTTIRCAAEAYGVDAEAITLDTRIREELSNKSLLMVAFISSIEEELDVKIDLRDAMKLFTIRDFAGKVSESVKQK
jgi:acyl carrier protein